MSRNVAFHLKDAPSVGAGHDLLQGWLRIVNSEAIVLAPWFEWQAECVRRIQAWWSWRDPSAPAQPQRHP